MTTTYDPTTIVSSLAAFGELPDWLSAGMDPRRVREGLEREVPELLDGRFRLLECTTDQLRAKGDEWHARYTLSVAEPGGEPREVVLVGNLWPPGREPSHPTDAPVGVAGFGEPGRRCLGWPIRRRRPGCSSRSSGRPATRTRRSPPATPPSCGTSRPAAAPS